MNYIYNDVELSALPERDKKKYPYAAIGKWLEVYELFLSTVPLKYRNSLLNDWYFDATEDGEMLVYQTTSDEMIWEEQDARTFSAGQSVYVSLCEPHWADYNVYYSTSGNLKLAASDPIPVVTAPTLDPLWLYMGWKAGNWVARQRGMRVEQPSTGIYDDTWPIEWNTLDVANNLRIPAETCQIYSYNGHEFGKPNIEPGYGDYHIIIKYDYGYKYLCLDQPLVYVKEDGEYAKTEGVYITTFICKTGEFSFGYHDDNIGPDNLKVLWGNVIWTNTDISDADGTVRMAATEPVYVREQVEVELVKVSNYIPTAEMLEKCAISVSYGGDEFVLSKPYVEGNDDLSVIYSVFLDFEIGIFATFAFKSEITYEGQTICPGLYYYDAVPSMYPSGTKLKLYTPEET